jgi:glycosyltransferase involved in cell wall biosynthesis
MSGNFENSSSSDLAARVTFVIPAFNSEHEIRDCIDSIRSVCDFEILVVDDGSSDRTAAVCESLGVKVVCKSNGGAYQARALGLNYVRSEYVYFLDSDDRVLPSFVDSITLLDKNPEYGCFLGSHVSVGEEFERFQKQVSGKLTAARLINCHYGFGPISASLWRTRDVIKVIDNLPEALSLSRGDDYELFIRCSLISNILCGDIIMAKYELPGGKSTKNLELSLKCTIEIASYYAKYFGIDYYAVPSFIKNSILVFRNLQISFYEQGIYKVFLTLLSNPRKLFDFCLAKMFFRFRSERFK